MRRKHLTVFLSLILVAMLSIAVTLAYLTDEDQATNTFTVGKVGIILDEAKVDEYGRKLDKDNKINPDSTERVTRNNYKLIPGHTYVKDPTVTVTAGSEDSYIRMIVTINKASELKAIFGEGFLPQDFVTGWNNEIWKTTEDVKIDKDSLVYEFRYHERVNTLAQSDEEVEDLKLDALFTHINFPGTVTEKQLPLLEGLVIDIKAHAIQADGFENADEAWTAFDQQISINN